MSAGSSVASDRGHSATAKPIPTSREIPPTWQFEKSWRRCPDGAATAISSSCAGRPNPCLAPASRSRLAFERLAQNVDIQLDHLHHGLHRARRCGLVGACDEFEHHLGHHLPGDAPAIPEPAAPLLLAALREERVPDAVDLGLIVAMNHQ